MALGPVERAWNVHMKVTHTILEQRKHQMKLQVQEAVFALTIPSTIKFCYHGRKIAAFLCIEHIY